MIERLGVVLLALLLPIITIFVFGWEFKSYSKLWGTELEWLFIIVNASTSFFFYSLDKWRMPAVLLLLLTAFSTDQFDLLHNVFASLFFISCIYPLYSKKLFLSLYLGSSVFALISLFYFEMVATYVICLFHLNSLYILWKFKNRNYER